MASIDTIVQETGQLDTTHLQRIGVELDRSATIIQTRERNGRLYLPENFSQREDCRLFFCLAFSKDIPSNFRPLTKCFFAFFVLYVILQIVSGVVTGNLLKYVPRAQGLTTMVVSVGLSLGLIGAAYFWYRQLYMALRDNAQKRFIVFQVCFVAQLVIYWVQALGIPYVSPGLIIAQTISPGNIVKQDDFETLRKYMFALGMVEMIHAGVGTLLLVLVSLFWSDHWRSMEQMRLEVVSHPV